MVLWPDAAYEESAQDVGLACLELLTNQPRWVHRRVETIDLLHGELVRRKVTVEFTVPERLRDDLRVNADGPWCVPLAILRKTPLRNFDLRQDGKAVPILGKDQNGPIARELILGAVVLTGIDAQALLEIAPRLDVVAQAATDEAHAALAQLVEIAADAPHVRRMLDDATAGWFLATLADSYLLIALLPSIEGRHILKYSYDDPIDFSASERSVRQRVTTSLGLGPTVFYIPVPAARFGGSYHAEVVVPEELRIDAAILDELSGNVVSSDVEVAVDRAALHVPRLDLAAEPVLQVDVRTERSGTPSVAVSTALTTTLLLGLGAGFGHLNSATAGSASAVVLAGSALFATVVARGGEHRLVRQVFLGSRLLLVAVALSALAAAASIGFGSNDRVRDRLWWGGAIVSAVATVSLAIAWKRAQPLRRRQDPSG